MITNKVHTHHHTYIYFLQFYSKNIIKIHLYGNYFLYESIIYNIYMIYLCMTYDI